MQTVNTELQTKFNYCIDCVILKL